MGWGDRSFGMVAGEALALSLLCSALLPVPILGQECDPYGPRKDCGYNGIPEQFCRSKGCCYSEAPSFIGASPMSLPACFYSNGGASTFKWTGQYNVNKVSLDVKGTIVPDKTTLPELGDDLGPLTVTIGPYGKRDMLLFQIVKENRFMVPINVWQWEKSAKKGAELSCDLPISSSGNSEFAYTVYRTQTRDPILTSQGTRLIYKDQYLEFNIPVGADSTLYGLGETTSSTGLPLRRTGWPYVLWNRDSPASLFDMNIYGSHPVLIEVRPDGSTHGFVMFNSNGMEVAITETRAQFRIVGGVIYMVVLGGPTPARFLDQLTATIGRPVMPPYWSLGLMQSKYGYGSVEFIDKVVKNYSAFNIPLETFVTDSQYMDKDQDFTVSPTYQLTEFQAFIASLHAAGQRWVPILDPVIHVADGYSAYMQGQDMDIWIKDITGRPYVGQLWPGGVNFPDFMSPQGQSWWRQQLEAMYRQLPFDGLWLDMNEPSNYCTGDVCVDPGGVGPRNDFVCELKCANGPDAFSDIFPQNRSSVPAGIFDPPFSINNANGQRPLSEKTIAVTASHYDGTLEYDVHNLFSYYEVNATFQVLQDLPKADGKRSRPFILTRSTWLGSGAKAAHWTGDTASTWEDMKLSIPSILANGLAGIAFTGADICGFMDYPDETLCARWAAIGAWYPYSRNHHAQGFQEFYRWDSVAEAARQNFGWRYRALPYLYTAFFESNQIGCPVARPLFFSWPGDSTARNISFQWMMGDALLISPILQKDSDTVMAYFPEGEWFSLYDYSPVAGPSGWKRLTAGLTDRAPIHVLGGHIIPLGPEGANLTSVARTGPLTLLVALARRPVTAQSCLPELCKNTYNLNPRERQAYACGHMYLDDGEQVKLDDGKGAHIYFTAFAAYNEANGHVEGQVVVEYDPAVPDTACGTPEWPPVTKVIIFNIPELRQSGPPQVGVQSAAVLSSDGAAGRRLHQESIYSGKTLSADTTSTAGRSLLAASESPTPPPFAGESRSSSLSSPPSAMTDASSLTSQSPSNLSTLYSPFPPPSAPLPYAAPYFPPPSQSSNGTRYNSGGGAAGTRKTVQQAAIVSDPTSFPGVSTFDPVTRTLTLTGLPALRACPGSTTFPFSVLT